MHGGGEEKGAILINDGTTEGDDGNGHSSGDCYLICIYCFIPYTISVCLFLYNDVYFLIKADIIIIFIITVFTFTCLTTPTFVYLV